MMIRHSKNSMSRGGSLFHTPAEAAIFFGLVVVVATTAAMTKQVRSAPALAAVDALTSQAPGALVAAMMERTPITESMASADAAEQPVLVESIPLAADAKRVIRYFDGRPVRPVRTVWMTVTAYSPDSRSCGKWADGVTASNKSIWTNGMKLVAADRKLFPFGSMLSVPGYDHNRIVPVLDRGGAIKGGRLDVLYPTHAIARKWGVRRVPVTIWAYVDADAGDH